MKLKIIKDGYWSKTPAYGPYVELIEGTIYEDEDISFCKRLIAAEYAVEIVEKQPEEPEEPEEDDDTISELPLPWNVEGYASLPADDKKDALEQYCLDVYGVDLDKRKSVKALEDAIKEMIDSEE